MTRALFRSIALCAAALALSGCISLLPKSKPAQLYRFGGPAAVAAANPRHTVGVFRTSSSFADEAAGDRILTVTGGRAAYIAQSRWVSPASVLFEQAVANGFEASDGHVRLLARGQQGKADYALRTDVTAFETRYASPDSAPTVFVRVHCVLTRADLTVASEQVFEARIPAADNRVGAIVDAYDKAVSEVVGKLVAWTNATAA